MIIISTTTIISSIVVFLLVMLPLVSVLLFVQEKLSPSGKITIKINGEKEIEVDGGISNKTSRLCIDKGADVLVAGSYIYDSPESDYKKLIKSLRYMDWKKLNTSFNLWLNLVILYMYRKHLWDILKNIEAEEKEALNTEEIKNVKKRNNF